MGRLGKWDEVEKKPRPLKFTRGDELWEYFKLSLICIGALAYLGYIFSIW